VIIRPFNYIGASAANSRRSVCFYSVAGSRQYDWFSFSVLRSSTGNTPASFPQSQTRRRWLSDLTSRSGPK
jgi:hypothetical protein